MENKNKNSVMTKVMILSAIVVAGASQAMAAATLTAPTFSLDDVGVVAGALMGGLAGFWAIRKGLSLIR